MFGYLSNIWVMLFGFLYPAYKSFKAFETDGKEDDAQWLTYWVCFSAFYVVEYYFGFILEWLPFYYEIKAAFICWLQFFNGAQTVYHSFVAPLLVKHEKKIDEGLSKIKIQIEQSGSADF